MLKARYPGLWFPSTPMVNVVTRELDTFEEARSRYLVRRAPRNLQVAVGHTLSDRVRARVAADRAPTEPAEPAEAE